MRLIFSTIILGLALATSAQKAPKVIKEGHKVEIKTSAVCDMCKEAIEYDLTFEKGVKTVVLDVDSKIATVVFNPKKTSADAIRKRICKVGYNADGLKRDPEAYKKLPLCCKDGAHEDTNHSKNENHH